MRAIVLSEYGPPAALQLRTIPIPRPDRMSWSSGWPGPA